MRPATVVVALIAGTAVRLLVSALPPFRRRRRHRSRNISASPASPPRRSRPSPHRPSSSEVTRQLNLRAPAVRADVWARSHPDPEECTFCLEPILPSRAVLVRETPCAHVFHAPCLERWVFYTADICLDWRHYSLADDGAIDAHVRPPTCPNCSADLRVLPHSLLRRVLLTTVARSLSLRDLAAAEEMYDAGLVYAPTTPAPPSAHPPDPPPPAASPAPAPAPPLALRHDHPASAPPPSPAPSVRPAFVVRTDSTASEPYLPAMAFVAHTDRVVHAMARRSLPDDFAASRATQGAAAAQRRPRRRRRDPRNAVEIAPSSRVVLQASS